jgi:starch synthase
MSKPKVLFVSQEITPYLGNSSLAEFDRYLPQAIFNKGKEVRIFMPRFGDVNERKNQLHEVIRLSGLNLVINDTDHPLLIKVASIPTVRMQIYFIDNEDFFQGKIDVIKDGKMIEDNDERSIFFARGVLETIKKLSWKPSVIHCSGWFSMLLPFYVKRTEYKNNPFFTDSKIIVNLYDDDFQGQLNENLMKKLKESGGTAKDWKFYKEPSYLNMMKAAISYSDGVVLTSENVNKELIDFANENKKHIIEFAPKQEQYNSINEFYDSIIVEDED